MKPILFREGDRLLMKKPHPCGNEILLVLRSGSDVRVKCEKCGRDVTLVREKLERNIKRVLPSDQMT